MLFQTKNVGHSKLWLMASRYKGRVIGFGANIISPKFHNACNRSFPHLVDISKLRIKVRMELRIRKERAPLKAGRIRLRGQIANANSPETKRESPRNKTDTQGAYCPYSIRELSRIVNRDFRGVYNDVQSLLNGGVLDKDGEKIVLPYDRIHIEFNSDDAAA